MKMKTLLAFVAILFTSSALAQVSTKFPFCLQGDDYPGWSNCTFTSFQQCQATASGTLNVCLSNPCYNAADAGPPITDGSASVPPNFSPLPVGPPPN
jgi:hypothetical protein